jgi:hypothetical protein
VASNQEELETRALEGRWKVYIMGRFQIMTARRIDLSFAFGCSPQYHGERFALLG